MNLTFTRPVPLAGTTKHGIQTEGLFTINTAQGTCQFSYRDLVTEPSDPTRQTPKPADEIKSMTVPLSVSDLASMAGIVFARTAALGMVDAGLIPSLAMGGPEAPPIQPSIHIDPVAAVAPGATVQLVASVLGVADNSVAWSVLDGGGSVGTDGTFSAPSEAGVTRICAVSAADPTKCRTIAVTISEG